MLEKRKFIRLAAAIGVTYKILKTHKRIKQALSLVKDIGGGGIRLLVKEDLRVGDLIRLEIQIPHLKEPIEAVGEVVWFSAQKDKDHERREAGAKFRDIDQKDLHKIFEYVHSIGIG